jgi:hypothetical protein
VSIPVRVLTGMPCPVDRIPTIAFPFLETLFLDACDIRARYHSLGLMSLQRAVDDLQEFAVRWGLVEYYGQDEIQDRLARTFSVEPEIPTATPVTVDRPPTPKPVKPSYRTPQATVDAFWYVVRNHDEAYLTRWLTEHAKDTRYLQKLWEAKCSPSK